MKKVFVILIVLGAAFSPVVLLEIFVWGAIFNHGKITVKGQDGTEYESYQECCEVLDFQAAHNYLIEMQKSDNERRDLEEAKEYVFNKEALYLMSLGTEEANNRLLYLLKERGTEDSEILKLIDLAIANGDDALVINLAYQVKNAHEIENKSQYLNDIFPILARYSEPKAVNLMVRYVLDEKDAIHRGTPVGTIMKEEEENRSYHEYAIRDANEFNELCDRILELALENNNKDLARKIVDEYVPVPCAWDEGKRVSFSNSAQMAAKERMKKAGF